MNTTARLPSTTRLAEGAVIVLSILVAFGLDAWWDYAKKRNAEADHLRALLIDFEQTRAGMEATIAHGERIIEHAKNLSAAVDADAAPTDARMDAMLFELMSLPTFEPVVGAYEELIGAGNLRLITDKELRAALAGWGANLRSYATRERWATDQWNLVNAPFLLQQTSLAQLVPRGALGTTVDNPHPRNHAELLQLPYFHNLVVYRWIAAKDAVESGKQLMRKLQQIVAQIEGALG
ncbi:MAG: hypothetical protein CMJ88_09410 [Planctomycetes bacterium]|nr:hypothetical protein [Planctomycetota bacterium]